MSAEATRVSVHHPATRPRARPLVLVCALLAVVALDAVLAETQGFPVTQAASAGVSGRSVDGGSALARARLRPSASDAWLPTSTLSAPEARFQHHAVWTGAEMIVWGGRANWSIAGHLNTGGRYDPVTDAWTASSTTNAPAGHHDQTVVWTGNQMIVWGGEYFGPTLAYAAYNTGGKYSPTADTWVSTTRTGAPTPRGRHTAVWTGSEMIVWGGNAALTIFGSWVNDGGRYNPATDTWVPTSITNAPSPRSGHVAVWTGTEMIVWGSYVSGDRSGGRYNPKTDAWIPTSTVGAPSDGTVAVWTGTEMIVWGGSQTDGGRYNPATDTWTPISTVNAPGITSPVAVWTGAELLVPDGTGQVWHYDPVTDVWTHTAPANPPESRSYYPAVWTGTELIMWGGWQGDVTSGVPLNTGGRLGLPAGTYPTPTATLTPTSTPVIAARLYAPQLAMDYNAASTWRAISTVDAPSPRLGHSSVWTGSKMLVWGGLESGCCYTNTGGIYDPVTDSWAPIISLGAPEARAWGTAVWTGNEMIVWGGPMSGPTPVANSGYRYDPASDRWSVMSTAGAPTARSSHRVVWTGSEMVVWGGFDQSFQTLNTGGRYNPSTDAWTAVADAGAPTGRRSHLVVWTGADMIVWGGFSWSTSSYLNTGGRYSPATDTWYPISTTGAPSIRSEATAVWTGTEMIVWGGVDPSTNHALASGGRYNPVTDAWTPVSIARAPSARSVHTAVWTGTAMVVWGGIDDSGAKVNTGGWYDPVTDTWQILRTQAAPTPRTYHTAVWSGTEVLIWGGAGEGPSPITTYGPPLNTGGRLTLDPVVGTLRR